MNIFQPVRRYVLTDYSAGLANPNPKLTDCRWMSESERDQAQSQIDSASCLVWEPDLEEPFRLSVQELVMAICSFYLHANGDQFAEVVQTTNVDLYLCFNRVATELGDFPVPVLQSVVDAYWNLVKAEAGAADTELSIRSRHSRYSAEVSPAHGEASTK